MNKTGRDTVQAVPLIEGQINVGAGTYLCSAVIHAESDAVLSFPDFKVPSFTYNIKEGSDVSFIGNFTVVSGTVTYQ